MDWRVRAASWLDTKEHLLQAVTVQTTARSQGPHYLRFYILLLIAITAGLDAGL